MSGARWSTQHEWCSMELGARGVLDGAYSMSGAQWSVRHGGGSIGAYGGQYRVLTRGATREETAGCSMSGAR